MFKKDLLKGKSILITGGGTGLGKEMGNHFAEHGADLYICGRRENVLEETANEITEKLSSEKLIPNQRLKIETSGGNWFCESDEKGILYIVNVDE